MPGRFRASGATISGELELMLTGTGGCINFTQRRSTPLAAYSLGGSRGSVAGSRGPPSSSAHSGTSASPLLPSSSSSMFRYGVDGC
jgi:hypothetical protein